MSFNFTVKEFLLGNGTGTPTLQFYKRGFDLVGSSASPSWRDIILSGNTALTLVNAKENGLNYLKLFGGTEQRNLPSEYTQVEYLETTGTQYIDTGVKPNSNTAISIKYYPAVLSAFMCLYGTQDSSSLNRFYGLISMTQFKLQINSNAGQPPSYWGINKNGTLVANDNGSFARTQGIVTLGVDNKNKVVSIESDEYTGNISASDTVLGDNLNCQYNMLLLSRGTAGTPANNFSGRLYSFTIKENDVLIQNLIPARRNSDNVLGMYDTVTGTFLTNQGTGTFTAGADVTAPTPETPMDIICNNGVVKVSPNLFDKNDVNLQNRNRSLALTKDGYWYYAEGSTSLACRCLPNTQYTISGISSSTTIFRVATIDINTLPSKQDTNDIPYSYIYRAMQNEVHTFVTPSTAKWIIVQVSAAVFDSTLNTIQIEQGSTATPYMPYGQIYTDGTVETVEVDTTGDTATAEMLLSLGDYKDVQSVLDGSVIHRCGIKVLDGTENWGLVDGTTSVYRGNINYMTFGSMVLCTHYSSISSDIAAINMSNNTIKMHNTVNGLIYIRDISKATAQDFSNYLADQYNAGSPVVVVYPLATPTTETVTPQPLSIQAGTNIVEITQSAIDNLGLEVSYKATV